MSFLRKLFGLAPKVDCHELLLNGAILIDVRTLKEFKEGKSQGAKNIPLDEIESKIGKLKKLNKVLVFCCRSGVRSGRATSILKSHGVEAYNGGAWSKFI